MTQTDKTTLIGTESHPSYVSALRYVHGLGLQKLFLYQEAFSSCAIENNRLAEVCTGTIRRLLNNELVGDRYLIGLAWTIKEMEEKIGEK